MTNIAKTIAMLSALLMLALPPVVFGGELDSFVKLVKAASKKALNDLDFVKDCLGMAEKPEICNAADAPGTPAGVLVCPAPSTPVVSAEVCNLKTSAGFSLSLGAKAVQLVKISGDFDTNLLMIGEEKSITRTFTFLMDQVTAASRARNM